MNKVYFLGCVSVILFACATKGLSKDATEDNNSSSDAGGSVNPPGDNGTNAPTNTGTPNNNTVPTSDGGSGDAGMTTDQCIASCQKQFPNGTVQGNAIDTCWTTKCDPSCTMMPDRLPLGKIAEPQDAGVLCGYAPVQTPSPSCSDCTQANCCSQWAACFSAVDSECSKLNRCVDSCYGFNN